MVDYEESGIRIGHDETVAGFTGLLPYSFFDVEFGGVHADGAGDGQVLKYSNGTPIKDIDGGLVRMVVYHHQNDERYVLEISTGPVYIISDTGKTIDRL